MNYCGKPPTVQNLIQELQKLDPGALVQVRGSGLIDMEYGIELEMHSSVNLYKEPEKSSECYCVILYSR